MEYKELVQVSREILINFKICRTLNTVSFNGKKLKVVLGKFKTHYINCKYGTKEVKLLQGIKSVIALEIEKAFQQKMLKQKEDGFLKGKQLV